MKNLSFTRRGKSLLPFLVMAMTCLFPTAASATVYYVDSQGGVDSNGGKSEGQAWRTVTPVQSQVLNPGDVVKFKCGSSFPSGLTISQSGSSVAPITFTSYGTGAKPVFKKSGQWTNAINVSASYVVVSDVMVRDSHQSGIALNYGANNNTVRNCEATSVGIGVLIRGNNNSVYSNNIHDLKMIVNDTASDNDYGANGVFIEGAYNDVNANLFVNCKGPSYDYGEDGGAVEFWESSTGNRITRNWAENCVGFVEMGSRGGTQSQITVAYNVCRNNGCFFTMHNSGPFGTNFSGIVFENNTVVDQPTGTGFAMMILDSYPSSWEYVTVRNNIFYVGNFQYVGINFSTTHYANVFYRSNPNTILGFNLNAGEKTDNPAFVNLGTANFRLQSASVAVNMATNVGYSRDHEYNPVPVGGGPDAGAYEKQ